MTRNKSAAKSASKSPLPSTAVGLSYNVTLRVRMRKANGTLARVLSCIARAGGDTGAIDSSREEREFSERDISVSLRDESHAELLVKRLNRLKHVTVKAVSNPVFLKHLRGKISVEPKVQINTREQLAEVYTPGVAQVCKAIAASPDKAWSLTIKGNTVAVVSDGSRVLSLGDIGPRAALPVMEGKAMLFKRFAGVDAFPLCLDTQDTEEIIATIRNIAPVFGAINLEDIASPRCYEIERRLQETLDIPVFHDDQHATSIAVLAATINASRLIDKPLSDLKVVACGVGAAGLASIKLLMAGGVEQIIGYSKDGAIYRGKPGLNEQEEWLAANSNRDCFKGEMREALVGADMFLGLSIGGVLTGADIKRMASDPIVFALANPVPEIYPEQAYPYARVVATGGSNYPNQINNALVFPGIFKGALSARVSRITEEMKMAAARALSAVVSDDELHEDYIIPGAFNDKVAPAVAEAVMQVASAQGLSRKSS